MWPFRRDKKLTKKILTVYAGSASVHAAWVEIETGAPETAPRVKSVVSHDMPIAQELVLASLLENTSKAIGEALGMMAQKGIGQPDQIVCFLSSPWYATQVRRVRTAKKLPFPVTPKLVGSLIKKELELFSRDDLTRYGTGADASVIIEKEITGITLDGYPASDPYNAETRELEISLLVSIAPSRVVRSFSDAIAGVFHSKNITFHSSAYAGVFVMRDLSVSSDDFLFADVGADVTDLVLVEKGAVKNVVSFPYGTDTLVRALSQRIGRGIPEVRPLVSLYSSGKLESSLRLQTEKSLEHAISPWRMLAESSLSSLSNGSKLPDTMFFLSSPGTELFQEAFSSANAGRKVMPVKEYIVSSFVSRTDPAIRNTRALIEALLVSRRYNS